MSLDTKIENSTNFYFTSDRKLKLVYLIDLLLRTIKDTFRLEKGIFRNEFQG